MLSSSKICNHRITNKLFWRYGLPRRKLLHYNTSWCDRYHQWVCGYYAQILDYTVQPIKFAHGSCFVVYFYGWLPVYFTHIHQDYFTGTGAILLQCQWNNPEEYGLIYHIDKKKTIASSQNTTKHNKTMCIFHQNTVKHLGLFNIH